jgi:cell fate regulator YaaT (PSP1 superfamily)
VNASFNIDLTNIIFQFCGKSRIDFGKLVEMDVINTFIQLGLINEEDDETFFEEAKFYYRKFYA